MTKENKLKAVIKSLAGYVTGGKYKNEAGKMVKFDPFNSMDSVRMMLLYGLKAHGNVTSKRGDMYHSQQTRFMVEFFCVSNSIKVEDFKWPAGGYGALEIFNAITGYPEDFAEAYGRTRDLW